MAGLRVASVALLVAVALPGAWGSLLMSNKTWDPLCITEPVGFGRRTTGGAGGKVVTPRTNDELKNALCNKWVPIPPFTARNPTNTTQYWCRDNEPRVIRLDRTFVFTGKNVSMRGCWHRECGPQSNYVLDITNHCAGKTTFNVTYDSIGQIPLVIGNNKTLIGINGKGRIVGRGLVMLNASNVIIRDLNLSDVNPRVEFAGDAIALTNVSDVWIHNVAFQNFGRMFIVTHKGYNTGITISSCEFDGRSYYSNYCDGRHYWVLLFWGYRDEITLINNFVHHTSGRAPHAGGHSKSDSRIHLISNYYLNIGEGSHKKNGRWAIEKNAGSKILAEGNVFEEVREPTRFKTNLDTGSLFFPGSPAEAGTCSKYFGEPCFPNLLVVSGANNATVNLDSSVLDVLGTYTADVLHARKAVCLPVYRGAWNTTIV